MSTPTTTKRASRSRLGIVGELWLFMKQRKAWWLAPILVTLLVLSGLILLAEGSAVAPFIYALF